MNTDQPPTLNAAQRLDRLHDIATMLGLTSDPDARVRLWQMLSEVARAAAADTNAEVV